MLLEFTKHDSWLSVYDIARETSLSKNETRSMLKRLREDELIERPQPHFKNKQSMYRLSEKGISVVREHPLLPNIEATPAKTNNHPINEQLVANQAFTQTITNLRQSIKKARKAINENNHIKVENEYLQNSAVTFFDEIDSGLANVIDKTDMSADPTPVQNNSEIRKWFKDEWPEAVAKFNEFTNKKALADMIVPSGIVAAFGLCGVVVGFVLGTPPVISFGAGSFIGMFATRQVSSKEVGKRIEDRLDEDKNQNDE